MQIAQVYDVNYVDFCAQLTTKWYKHILLPPLIVNLKAYMGDVYRYTISVYFLI